MRRFRFLLVAAGAVVALLLLALGVAGSSAFQTWAVRRALARSGPMGIEIGKIEAGWGLLRAKEVRIERSGAQLTVPQVEAEFSWWELWREKRLSLRRVRADGWTLQPRRSANTSPSPTPASAAAGDDAVVPAGVAAGTAAALHAFHGLFAQFRLPVDLAVESAALRGQLFLPERNVRAEISLRGGGLKAGHDGAFDLSASVSLAEATEISALTLQGTLKATLDTPRTFSALAARFEAEARGAAWPSGVKLTAGVTAARGPSGELYSARILGAERQLFSLRAELPRDGSRVDGTWKIDARDVDVAPFLLGVSLPRFALVGEGVFDADASFAAVHVTGRLSADAEQLGRVHAVLAPIGAVKLGAEFDLLRRGEALELQRFDADVSGPKGVASVKLLQPAEWHTRSMAGRLREPGRDLLGVRLHGLPIAWLRPWTAEWLVTGDEVRGELSVGLRAGGVFVRSNGLLNANNLSVETTGVRWLRDVDLSGTLQADLTPKGWSLELARVAVKQGADVVAAGEVRLGRLAGEHQPVKAAVRAKGDFGLLRQQPLGGFSVPFAAGTIETEIAVGAGEKLELEGNAVWRDAKFGGEAAREVPDVKARMRIDIDAKGRVAVNLPLIVERAERKSDLLLVGEAGPLADGVRPISVQITGARLHLNDVEFLAGLFAAPEPAARVGPAAAPWHGWHGDVALQLKEVIYPGKFELTKVTGVLRIERETLTLEGLKFGHSEAGTAEWEGQVSFDGRRGAAPLAWDGRMLWREIDPARLVRGPMQGAPPIEGRFDVAGRLRAHGDSFPALWAGQSGELQLTSRGGVFRALPISVGTAGDSSSTIASLLASASAMIGGIRGRRDAADITNRSQAITELARAISNIAFDQLAVAALRGPDGSVTLRDISLIAPEIRLQGSGRTTTSPEASWPQYPVLLELSLRARGRTAELLRYLGLLDTHVDDLGYAGCTVPIGIAGTLGDIDARDTSRRLVAAAFEKAGFIDKAADWLARQRGRSPRPPESNGESGK